MGLRFCPRDLSARLTWTARELLHLLLLCQVTLLCRPPWGRLGRALFRDAGGLCRGLLDHLVGQNEVELRYRDEAVGFRFFIVFLLFFAVCLAMGAGGRLEEQDARVDGFEVATLYRGSVFTDYLHGETPLDISLARQISTTELATGGRRYLGITRSRANKPVQDPWFFRCCRSPPRPRRQ